jgi:hypothetical protein
MSRINTLKDTHDRRGFSLAWKSSPDVDVQTKIILNVLHLIARQLCLFDNIKSSQASTKRAELKRWSDLVNGRAGKTADPVESWRQNVEKMRDSLTDGKGTSDFLAAVLVLLSAEEKGAPDATQAKNYILSLDSSAGQLYGRNESASAGAASVRNEGGVNKEVVYVFLGWVNGNAKSLPQGLDNPDQKDWLFATNLVYECIGASSGIVHGFDKMVVQHFLVLLLSQNTQGSAWSSTPTSAKAKVAEIRTLSSPYKALVEIIQSAGKFLTVEQQEEMQRRAMLNKSANSSRKRRINQDGPGGPIRRRREADSDSDDDEEEERYSRKKGKHDKEHRDYRSQEDVLFLLYNLRLTKDFFLALISHNVPFPMTFDLLQQWIRLSAGCTIFLRTGITTGLMAINEAAMMFSRNPETFTVRVYARFSCGTIIRARKNLEFVPHTYCTGYKGGAGLRLFDYTAHLQSFHMGNFPFDVMPIANPFWYKPPIIHTDITGEQSRDLYSGPQENWAYPTSQAYNSMMQWGRSHVAYPHVFHRNFYIEGNPRHSYVVCFVFCCFSAFVLTFALFSKNFSTISTQSTQRVWEPSPSGGKGSITYLIPGRGPLGQNVEPADFDVLRGTSEFIGRGIEGILHLFVLFVIYISLQALLRVWLIVEDLKKCFNDKNFESNVIFFSNKSFNSMFTFGNVF